MRVIRHAADAETPTRPRIVAAGEFDGLHRGHQRILATVQDRARAANGESMVIVARERGSAPRLDDRRRQIERLRDAGVDAVVFAPIAELAAAVDRVGASVRVSARGSAATAPGAGRLEEIEPLSGAGAPISSAAIRGALARGDLRGAAELLGRDPGVTGRIVHGFHRGRPLGIPTANMRLRGIQLPPDGVYAVRARLADGANLHGVANIGFNPTFGNQTRTVETHLLDYDGDLYGQRLEVTFLKRLRGEQKFASVPELLAQIRDDIAVARRYFVTDGG